MIKGFRTMLYPNKEQQHKIIQFCNAARWAYNWGLSKEEENYKNGGKFISGYNLNKMLTEYKKQEGNEWLKEISGRALKVSLLNIATAFERFFKKKAKYPKYKSKKNSKMKCATHEGTTIIERKRIRMEKLGWISCHKNNIPNGNKVKYLNPKIEYDGVNFWFSVSVEVIDNQDNDNPKTDAIGIDLGIKQLATCSNGMNLSKPNIKKLQSRAESPLLQVWDGCRNK